MTWRRVALAAAWIIAAAWGIFYLVVLAPSSAAYIGFALAHFLAGYAFGTALMTRPMTPTVAVVGTGFAGALTVLALHSATPEWLFAPVGPLAAVAVSDHTTARNIAPSAAAFAVGFIALAWLVP